LFQCPVYSGFIVRFNLIEISWRRLSITVHILEGFLQSTARTISLRVRYDECRILQSNGCEEVAPIVGGVTLFDLRIDQDFKKGE
jgi:hypothetical protein